MLNYNIIKLETIVNLGLLMLIITTIRCSVNTSTAYTLTRILLEISLEMLTTIVFHHTIVWSIITIAKNTCSVNWQSNLGVANLGVLKSCYKNLNSRKTYSM